MATVSDRAKALNRRTFLGLGIAASALPLLAACGAQATPTAAPAAKPTEAPKAAEPTKAPEATKPAAEPTKAAAAQPTQAAAASADGNILVASKLTPENWNPEVLKKIAGTLKEVDTKGAVAKVMPLETKVKLTFWYDGPTQATPVKEIETDKAFWAAWNEMVPGVPMKVGENVQNLDQQKGYLDKIRTAVAGGAGPHCAKMPIMWGCEFAGKGLLRELQAKDLGYSNDSFWPGAIKSNLWKGKLYGVPSNNEAMALVYNKKMFKDAGLDDSKPPATWEDVVAYSKAIKDKTGKAGYGLLARVNAGNTPFRFMPMLWAYGSGALDEAEAAPTMEKVMVNNDGAVKVFDLIKKMYVDDKSAPTSALTNTNQENTDLFIAGQIAMYIAHPSEYATLVDRTSKATGSDKQRAQEILDNTAYGLIPTGPTRRAVVFGGSNFHILTDKAAGAAVPVDAARGFGAMYTGPEWSLKRVWSGSNPGHLEGFKTEWMKQRLSEIKFLENTTSMLPYGVPFPVIPEATEIMNNIIPTAMQNVLTGKMSSKQAADDAADKIAKVLAQRKD